MTINDFTQIYRRTVTGVGVTNGTVRLKLNRIKARKIRTLTRVTVENQTLAYDKCRLGINNGGIDFYLDELTTIAADELAVSRSDILLGEGDVFFAELTGTDTGDVLIMTCIGRELDI